MRLGLIDGRGGASRPDCRRSLAKRAAIAGYVYEGHQVDDAVLRGIETEPIGSTHGGAVSVNQRTKNKENDHA